MTKEAQLKWQLQSREWLRNLEIDCLSLDFYEPLFHCVSLVKLRMSFSPQFCHPKK